MLKQSIVQDGSAAGRAPGSLSKSCKVESLCLHYFVFLPPAYQFSTWAIKAILMYSALPLPFYFFEIDVWKKRIPAAVCVESCGDGGKNLMSHQSWTCDKHVWQTVTIATLFILDDPVQWGKLPGGWHWLACKVRGVVELLTANFFFVDYMTHCRVSFSVVL